MEDCSRDPALRAADRAFRFDDRRGQHR
jgi:hypothetical protein